MAKIELTSGGPIEGTFPIDLSPGPGVYEFRGKRGSGKTTCISSIDLLAGHKVDVTLHDGAISGKVEGFGGGAGEREQKENIGNRSHVQFHSPPGSVERIAQPNPLVDEIAARRPSSFNRETA